MRVIIDILVAAGLIFALAGTKGVIQMPDAFCRMQASTCISTLGVLGVIVGGAFGAITTSLVSNVITPLLAALFQSPNPDALNITLRAGDAAAGTEPIVLGLGTFLGTVINFLVIALVLFSVIKAINKARELTEKKEEEAPAEPEEPKPTTEELLGAILEEIKKK